MVSRCTRKRTCLRAVPEIGWRPGKPGPGREGTVPSAGVRRSADRVPLGHFAHPRGRWPQTLGPDSPGHKTVSPFRPSLTSLYSFPNPTHFSFVTTTMAPLASVLMSLATLATLASASEGVHDLPLTAQVKRSSLSGANLMDARIASHEALKTKYGFNTDESASRFKKERRAQSSVTLAGNDLVGGLTFNPPERERVLRGARG